MGSVGIPVALFLLYGLGTGCDPISSGLTVSARAVPSQEWVLQQGADGEITGSLTDHLQGRRLSRTILGCERDDRIIFETHPELAYGTAVAAGDTIGRRVSALNSRRQVELQGQLDVERAYLAMARSGHKASLVREAGAELDLARAEAEQQRRQLTRQQRLFERNLVAIADLELAAAAVESADLNIHIAEAQLQTARTGSRDQEIAWVEARIADLLSQLEQVRLDIAADVVCSPIGGRFLGGRGDTLAVVQDTTTWAAVMPVSWYDRQHLRPGLGVELVWEAGLAPSTGQLTRLGTGAFSALDGRQFVAVVARLDSVDSALVPGLVGQCRINDNAGTWLDRLQRILAL
ncbi:MAG: hypothetical protein HN712_03945 [Gemmatimonadetes bacterium]|nr:hypothetical protein [Gemmatimonadota bacterium]MBT7859434.1 hypothetical protein [Gemmatimonadota bacterium]